MCRWALHRAKHIASLVHCLKDALVVDQLYVRRATELQQVLTQHVADAQGPTSAHSDLRCPCMPPDAKIDAKESETPEQALQRRLKESARVEERVTQIYTAQDFQHHLEQVLTHLYCKALPTSTGCLSTQHALLTLLWQRQSQSSLTMVLRSMRQRSDFIGVLSQAINWILLLSGALFPRAKCQFHCTCRLATI